MGGSPVAVALRVADALESCGVRYVVGGSLASSISGEPRSTLDVDIVWMDGVEMDDEALTIPHPRWKERRFVLAPLRDLAPELVDERDLQLADGTVRRVEDL